MKATSILLLVFLLTPFSCEATSDGKDEFDDLYEQSKAQANGRPIAGVLFELAQQRASTGKTTFTNMGKLANYLADDFSLYSNLHGEVVRDHCRASGSDMTGYLSALAHESVVDAEVARKIYQRLGVTYDRTWELLKPQAVQGVAGLVENFSNTLNVPTTDFCGKLASDPTGSARRLSYASTRATRSQVLRAISP